MVILKIFIELELAISNYTYIRFLPTSSSFKKAGGTTTLLIPYLSIVIRQKKQKGIKVHLYVMILLEAASFIPYIQMKIS